MVKRRRTVEVSEADGARGRLFAFGWEQMGAAVGMKARAVKRRALKGEFDPTDLVSLAWWVTGKHLSGHARTSPRTNAT